MNYRSVGLIALVAGLLLGCGEKVDDNKRGGQAACPPPGYDRSALLSLRENGFKVEDDGARAALALSLIDCLGAPDPVLRDQVAFEAIASWTRGGVLSTDVLTTLTKRLMSELQSPDPTGDGFRLPFAALVLSEMARADRLSPFLTTEDRGALVQTSTDYLKNVRDYRGFVDGDGWRHGVAHGADLVMQLVLNEKTEPDQLAGIRDAVASQVAPPGVHYYVHGEAARLARPILYLTLRSNRDEAGWETWFMTLANPSPMADWSEAFQSEEGLAKLHNTKAFAMAIYVNASASSNENLKVLLPGVTQLLKSMP